VSLGWVGACATGVSAVESETVGPAVVHVNTMIGNDGVVVVAQQGNVCGNWRGNVRGTTGLEVQMMVELAL